MKPLTGRQREFLRNLLSLYRQAKAPVHYSDVAERLGDGGDEVVARGCPSGEGVEGDGLGVEGGDLALVAQQRKERAVAVVEQHRTVVEEPTCAPALGVAGEFLAVRHEVVARRAGKTGAGGRVPMPRGLD